MTQIQLKLKQASVASGVPSKDLQNLVQAGVLKPKKSGECYWFNPNQLLQAKVAWYLRETMGISTDFLIRILAAISKADSFAGTGDVVIQSRLEPGAIPLEIRVPLGRLSSEIEQQLPAARAIRYLPRGRKRAGWKQELLSSLEEAGTQLGNLKRGDILRTISDARKTRRSAPEISVVTYTRKKVA